MEKTIYVYHVLSDKTYVPIDKDYIEIVTEEITFLEGELVNSFLEFSDTYAQIRIPKSYYKILKELLEKYKLSDRENQFITLIAAIQKTFIEYFEGDYETDLFVDFESEYKETELFLNLLKKYLFHNDLKWLKSIKFDNVDYIPSTSSERLVPEHSLITISNIFLVKDIYAGICDNWNLRRDNYLDRREEILAGLNTFKYKKGGILYKKKIAEALYKFLYPDIISGKNKTYRFIGLFLMLSQINYKNIDIDIELHEAENVKYNLNGIIYQYIQKLIERDIPSF